MAGRVKKAGLAFLAAFAVTACAIGFAGFHLFNDWEQPGPLSAKTTVVIDRGANLESIATTLYKAGVIDDALVFQIVNRLNGDATRLKAGEYVFPAGVSPAAATRLLVRGLTVARSITIPEGLTTRAVVRMVRAADGVTGVLRILPEEGALLPETYHYSLGDSVSDIIGRMEAAMDDLLDREWPRRQEGLPLDTPREAVILASIVERETGLAGERPRVAAVFINRLRKGMRLQSDPTVVYGLTPGEGDLGRRLRRSDLREPTPYNTYTIAALPPGPIANPGADAIRAVLNPLETDEFYFVADGTGGHAFARTLAEHNANVRQWRRIQRERAGND